MAETVYVWKQFTEGVPSFKDNKMVTFKPRESAEIMGTPIKTLYDYMYSLKVGR